MKKGKNIIISAFLLIAIMATTVVYSAFSARLQISGEAVVRSDNEIRISNMTVLSQTNGAYETYNYKYNKDMASMYATLPANSTITYEIDITNKSGSDDYGISNIVETNFIHTNATYQITGCSKGNVITAGTTKKCVVTFTNNSNQELDTLILKFSFEKNKVVDLSGNNITLSVNNAVSTDDGLYFNGTNAYAATDTLDYQSSKAITVDFVAKISYSTIYCGMVLESSPDWNSNNAGWGIAFNEENIANDMRFTSHWSRINDTDMTYNIKSSTNLLANNQFKHYTFIMDNTKTYNNFITAYGDGVVNTLHETNAIHTLNTSNRTFQNYPFFLASRNGKATWAKVTFKEVRLYNKALSQSEITANHNGNIVTDHLMLYYKFD